MGFGCLIRDLVAIRSCPSTMDGDPRTGGHIPAITSQAIIGMGGVYMAEQPLVVTLVEVELQRLVQVATSATLDLQEVTRAAAGSLLRRHLDHLHLRCPAQGAAWVCHEVKAKFSVWATECPTSFGISTFSGLDHELKRSIRSRRARLSLLS
jgi:hypothetical protein